MRLSEVEYTPTWKREREQELSPEGNPGGFLKENNNAAAMATRESVKCTHKSLGSLKIHNRGRERETSNLIVPLSGLCCGTCCCFKRYCCSSAVVVVVAFLGDV